MNLFETYEEKYKKAVAFFQDPNISEGRKSMKMNEFKEIEGFINSPVYWSEVLGLKFKILGRKVIFETGTEFYVEDVEKMKDFPKDEVLRLYKLFTIFKNSTIL